jgi:iron(II)-dependent oxidoreductase
MLNLASDRKGTLRARLVEVRERTLWLLDRVPDEFLQRRVHQFYSPIGWHFGHVGRTEEYWVMCAALQQSPCDERLDFLYTDREDNPKDNRVNIPGRDETKRFMARTRERVLEALDRCDLETDDPFLRDGYAWEFAIQHECQHQETICEMLHLIQRELDHPHVEATSWPAPRETRWIELPAGRFTMGTDDPTAYDNEKDPHEVSVAAFRLAETQVTCAQWEAFRLDGGYARPELWSVAGWAWRESEAATAPEYWVRQGDGWAAYGPFGLRALHADEPVCGVSWHEAEAFARWSGKRLPTEAEWEYAARAGIFPWGDDEPSDGRARYRMEGWSPSPVGAHRAGATPEGIEDMAGNVWEWTSTPFLPYPGFVAFPYDGYSKDHMLGGHQVCRGGSWATAGPILRRTFRNWYVPTYRQGFLGLRLAETA